MPNSRQDLKLGVKGILKFKGGSHCNLVMICPVNQGVKNISASPNSQPFQGKAMLGERFCSCVRRAKLGERWFMTVHAGILQWKLH